MATYDVGRILKPMYLSGRSPFVESFFVGKDGSVHVLTDWYKGQLPEVHTIVVFDSDGSVNSIIPIRLDGAPQIMHFAQFGDGRYLLVVGYWGNRSFNRVDAVVISSSGKVLRDDTLRMLSSAEEAEADRDVLQDIKAREEQQQTQQKTGVGDTRPTAIATATKSGEKAAARPDYAMRALFSETLLLPGDDGNIYMVRPDRLGMLYKVSESGTITPIHLFTGSRSVSTVPNTQVMGGMIRNGELMLCYVKFDLPADSPKPRTMESLVIKIYDLASHQLIVTYSGNQQLSPLLIGWDGQEFYFLRYVKNGQHSGFGIEKATP